MFCKVLRDTFPKVTFLGYIDKAKKGDDIHHLNEIREIKFDQILILSANHFDSIYSEYSRVVPLTKLVKVQVINNTYKFSTKWKILRERIYTLPKKVRMKLLSFLVFFLEKTNYQRKGIVFISKSFIGNNSKALFVNVSQKPKQVSLLTDNLVQLNKLKSKGFNVQILDSCRAMWKIASAKTVILDQGNFTEPLKALSSKQITIQMWHGVPLKRMNRMENITYDAMISTSDYVNDTSLADVIVSRKYFNYGYPRNDLLLKEHDAEDLVLCDMELYDLAKSHFTKGSKVIVYMPTHRESATSIDSTPPPLIPLNFESLDLSLKKLDARLIVKLHPFVKQFQDMHMPKKGYENIHFHSAEGDIYPLLKYTDILITDYSSIYFDFLLLDRPIIFFSYDYEEYSSNMNGFVYDYESFAPGSKVKTEKELVAEIEKQVNGEDKHRTERKFVRDKFYTYQDAESSSRICEKFNLLN